MTITLGGLSISDNMYLSGLESAPRVMVEQLRTIDGVSHIQATPLIGGRDLTIGTQNLSGAIQGIWCMDKVEQVKELEQQAVPVVLDYRGDTYNVVITKCSFTPMLQFEVEGPNKKFIGSVSLTEV